MLKKIIMPAGGQTSSDGKIVKWNKKPGDKVKKWDVIVEIETDKSVVEIEASGNGVFLGSYHDVGETVQAGTVLGYIGNEGDVLPAKDGADAPAPAPKAEPAVNPAPAAAPLSASLKKIIMPAGGQTSSDGKIVKWNKKPGDKVKKWDVIVEIETDKSVVEIEASGNGVFLGSYHDVGETVQAGTVLGYIGKEGDVLPPKDGAPAPEAAPAASVAVIDDDDEYQAIMPDSEQAKAYAASKAAAVEAAPVVSAPEKAAKGNYPATPGAKKAAKEKGIALADVVPANGKTIKKSDVDAYVPEEEIQAEAAAPVTVQGRETEYIPTSGMRKAIARKMNQSLTEAALYHLLVKVDMTDFMATLKKLNEGKEKADKVSINDLLMKATCLAIKKHPIVNSTYGEEQLAIHHAVHFGLAVAVDNGLVVPVVRDADLLSLKDIAKANKANIEKCRSGKYSARDISGSTITISPIGSFGIYVNEPVLNYPESCILGVGVIEDVLKMVDGEVVVRKEMCIAAGFDHRIVDGAEGGKFLKTLKGYLEDPSKMLLELV